MSLYFVELYFLGLTLIGLGGLGLAFTDPEDKHARRVDERLSQL